MKSKIYFLILMILFSLYFASASVYADEKKLDVSVNVVDASNNSNYLNLDNFGSSGGTGGNEIITGSQAEEVKDISLDERGINPQYLRGAGELASTRLSSPWFFPIVLIIFAIILIIIYFLRKKWKKRKILKKRRVKK